jgi:hypothetical protein
MTTLPATVTEAEALAFAVDWLRRFQEYADDIGGVPLDPATEHLFAKQWCRMCAEAHVHGAEGVVELAITHGEPSAHEALVEIIDEKTERNEPLGAILGAYSIRLHRRPFQPHSGPPRTTLIRSVIYSVLIVELVDRFRLHPTRRQRQRPSACSIVAAAAQQLGLHRGGEDAFRQVFKRTAPMFVPGSHVASLHALKVLAPYAR